MRSRPLALKGRLAVVTGAGSGIGKATAKALAREGMVVICADIRPEAAESTAEELSFIGVGAKAYGVDVADKKAMEAFAARVLSEHGVPTVLVNNAGVGHSGHFLETELADWDWLLSINFFGVLYGCCYFAPKMVERGEGHIVNVSSVMAFLPRATEAPYVTSKAAVLALSRCLRNDLKGSGVGVSAVAPGIIATNIISATRFTGSQGQFAPQVEKLFATRGHDPSVVAEAVLRAIKRNRALVFAGVEAAVLYALARLLPVEALDALVARAERVATARQVS